MGLYILQCKILPYFLLNTMYTVPMVRGQIVLAKVQYGLGVIKYTTAKYSLYFQWLCSLRRNYKILHKMCVHTVSAANIIYYIKVWANTRKWVSPPWRKCYRLMKALKAMWGQQTMVHMIGLDMYIHRKLPYWPIYIVIINIFSLR